MDLDAIEQSQAFEAEDLAVPEDGPAPEGESPSPDGPPTDDDGAEEPVDTEAFFDSDLGSDCCQEVLDDCLYIRTRLRRLTRHDPPRAATGSRVSTLESRLSRA